MFICVHARVAITPAVTIAIIIVSIVVCLCKTIAETKTVIITLRTSYRLRPATAHSVAAKQLT